MTTSVTDEEVSESGSKPIPVPGTDVFTDYVDTLDPSLFEVVLTALRRLLRREVSRRGLYEAPPRYLGVVGDRWAGEPLDELTGDAYYFIFVRRLRGLQAQRLVRTTLRPMVVRNIRNFLTERHRTADPIGYRIFSRLRAAVEHLLTNGTLTTSDSHTDSATALGNKTMLTFRGGVSEPATSSDLFDFVGRWNDELLPELILAETRAVPAVIEQLVRKLEGLREAGIDAFQFGDVITPLAHDTRHRWANLWRHEIGELGVEGGNRETPGDPILIVRPDEEPDWPDRAAAIEACVASKLDDAHPPRNRRHLWKLWQFVHSTRLASGADATGPLPALSEIGRHLQISRDRVRVLFERLSPIVLACVRDADRPPQARSRDQRGSPTPNHPLRSAAQQSLSHDHPTHPRRTCPRS